MNLKILVLATLVVLCISARSRFGNRGVAKTGGYLGDSLASVINMFRSKPQPMPKNYKREYERPVKEEHTLAYKFKNGLKNFLYLGYALIAAGVGWGLLKVYNWMLKTYYKYKISSLPSQNRAELRTYKKLLEQMETEPLKPKSIKKNSE